LEANETIGGGTRTAELTLPGFRHDVCSAVHPLVTGSPFFQALDLDLELVESPAELAHPLDDGTAVLVHRSLEETAHELGPDGRAYTALIGPYAARWPELANEILAPILHVPRHPVTLGGFSLHALRSAEAIANSRFRSERTRALFAGAGAHSFLPLDHAGTAAFALVLLLLAHREGWPFVRGGSQWIADALAARLQALGGEIQTGTRVARLTELPKSELVFCDVTPRQLLALAGDALTPRYRRALAHFRYGPGVFKLDYALDGPIPWRAAAVAEAATVHVGGPASEIGIAERAVWDGGHPERPFVLLAQHTLFDQTRAPAGKHTAWAYCHVPHGSTFDMRERVEAQIERFAPGFKERILACATHTTVDIERVNANMIGGDISGGANTLAQLIARPALKRNPYATPLPGLFLCSASTPPGGGVHGMCGYLAAKSALSPVRGWRAARRSAK
jgi:phytoene dehydrogenase-like protein